MPIQSLESMRKQAKRLLKSIRAGDTELVQRYHPRPDQPEFKLADAQLILARQHGFASWPKLKHHAERVWQPPQELSGFFECAILNYGNWHPSHAEKAREMTPPARDLYVAATVGDAEFVRRHGNTDTVDRPGGPFQWPALLYACYSRVADTLEAGQVLLQKGADPNAGFLWNGNLPPFTALTGVLGEGEAGVNHPPHPRRDEFAVSLLEAGADPNDGQALYNLTDRDNKYLRLLLKYGLGKPRSGPWQQDPAALLTEELWCASRENRKERARILLEHGADPNAPGVRDGRTPYERALMSGNDAIAEMLLEYGAEPVKLSKKQAFFSACVSGRREEARRQRVELSPEESADLVHRAAAARRPEALRLVAELGFDVNAMVLSRTPLHDAAWRGELDTIRLLLELGADPCIRDGEHQGTPQDWARYNQQEDAAELLANETSRCS